MQSGRGGLHIDWERPEKEFLSGISELGLKSEGNSKLSFHDSECSEDGNFAARAFEGKEARFEAAGLEQELFEDQALFVPACTSRKPGMHLIGAETA